jgi:hypothetical protein
MTTQEVSNEKGIEWARGNPLRRCVATSSRSGKRCRNWAIRGGTVCRYHGGSTRHVKRKANENFERACDLLSLRVIGIALGDDVPPAVALAAAKDGLDRAGLGAKAEVSVELKPWEQLMGDIAGIAAITRAEHCARSGVLPDQSPARSASAEFEVVDAEVVAEPGDRDGPTWPALPVDQLRAPHPVDVPADESAGPTGLVAPPSGTLTYEEAAAVMRQSRIRTNPVGRKGRVRRVQ